ncbi:myotubularin-related protein 10 isoform X1 [Nerophis lumbriciformis]|uniref:myotubularin-related protein 10 isoform X1 n=1 Tax=Nerophis lumbriciformis TaxID=546530 RepID=UPI002ADFE1E8|nr:myotubularin-related protein 10-like isoform X1 [Nerophis lumbriciformis]XP_061820050.1 myotubularin-related protein 10-like isoform X1 [Nerophis lumbriciformis]XP_061820051.1 myotubularin-related protein 10-like isoform X1 [Nerophis lumbriciformis]
MFSVKPIKPTFKCYLPPLQGEVTKTIDPPIKKLEPKLLPGEIVVNEANFVRKCISPESSQDDLWGKLICTNFKVSFIPQDSPTKQKFQLSHLLLGDHDVPLTCLEHVVTVNDTKGKKKVLGSNQKLKFNPTELILYCKDLRIIRFCFDEAGPESAKKVCLAIAHYSHPADLHLLFGFEYQGRRYHECKAERLNGSVPRGGLQTAIFDRPSDWDREIKRTGASEWRVCSINEFYCVSSSLPEFIVVPVSLADQDLKQYSIYFTDNRLPLWCWNHPNGSALLRTASVCDPVQQRKIEQRIITAITKSNLQCSEVFSSDLDKCLPNIQEIQSSFIKIRQICVIDPFEESEERWLSAIENSRWLEYVRAFLKHAAEMVYHLEGRNVSVVLQEEEDRDLNCVVSSLVQLMLDPHYRSFFGFQSLVQKEWVMAGHRFLDRCNHLKKNDKEESPVFMLFLDCVWQMMNQYPAAFEFTETYLTVLSDSMWIPLFSTFLFSSSKQRAQCLMDFARNKAIPQGEDPVVYFPPVWNWSQQFSLKDQTLFNNPMYVGKGASCVLNGEVKCFRRTKKYGSILRGASVSLRNGLRGAADGFTRRGSLGSELKPEFSVMKEVVESPSERFIRDWFSRPADQQGLLIPLLTPSHVTLWKLYFLRWVPEACIPMGGSITAYHKLSQLVDEIEMLRDHLRQYKAPTPGGTPNPSPRGPPAAQRRMYFKAASPTDSPPEFLSSTFPFTPVGNLCRRSIHGTPISKFLNGARIWLSTETLANDSF